MVSKSFIIKRIDFEKKPITIFQHKLRLLMKCYTIRELQLDEITQNLKFKKSYKIGSLKMDDPKQTEGRYEIEDIKDSGNIILRLII